MPSLTPMHATVLPPMRRAVLVAAIACAAPGAPAQATAGDAAAGREVFNQYCYHCHGTDAVQGERPRDLRRLVRRYGDERHAVFLKTVTEGRTDKGMPVWNGVLTRTQLSDIWAFLETVQVP